MKGKQRAARYLSALMVIALTLTLTPVFEAVGNRIGLAQIPGILPAALFDLARERAVILNHDQNHRSIPENAAFHNEVNYD